MSKNEVLLFGNELFEKYSISEKTSKQPSFTQLRDSVSSGNTDKIKQQTLYKTVEVVEVETGKITKKKMPSRECKKYINYGDLSFYDEDEDDGYVELDEKQKGKNKKMKMTPPELDENFIPEQKKKVYCQQVKLCDMMVKKMEITHNIDYVDSFVETIDDQGMITKVKKRVYIKKEKIERDEKKTRRAPRKTTTKEKSKDETQKEKDCQFVSKEDFEKSNQEYMKRIDKIVSAIVDLSEENKELKSRLGKKDSW